MLRFDEAKGMILEKARPLPRTEVAVGEALGLVLVSDLIAPIDLPPFDNSAMDGFALAVADLTACGSRLPISQRIMAGDVPTGLAKGSCARIMTGAMLPPGADTVVPIEDARPSDDAVAFPEVPRRGQHVRHRGEDVAAGTVAARQGESITSRQVALFSALGLTHVAVHRRPAVAVITTGSELVPPGAPLCAGKIHDSNGPALCAALSEMNLSARCLAVSDDAGEMRAAVEQGFENMDILITVGGVSVGDSDHVKACLESLGAELVFWRIAMKPGKPVAFWTVGEKLIFGLPGNPVSCLVALNLLVRPAILRMMGRRDIEGRTRTAVAVEKLKGSAGKRDFLCGRSSQEGESLVVAQSGPRGSAMIRSLSDADCLIVIPEEVECVEEGETVEIELIP